MSTRCARNAPAHLSELFPISTPQDNAPRCGRVKSYEFSVMGPVATVLVVNPKGTDGKFMSKKALLVELLGVLRSRAGHLRKSR